MSKLNPKQQVNMTVRQIEKIKENATDRAVNIVSLFPLLVLRDNFGFGEKRLKRYQGKFKEMFSAYNEGYIDLEDIAKVLKEETNIEIF